MDLAKQGRFLEIGRMFGRFVYRHAGVCVYMFVGTVYTDRPPAPSTHAQHAHADARTRMQTLRHA